MEDRYLIKFAVLISFEIISVSVLEITPVKLKKEKVKFDRHELNMNCFKLRLV